MTIDGQRRLLLTLASEFHMKSPRTRRWFKRQLHENIRAALAAHAPDARLVDDGRRLLVDADDIDRAGAAASRVFGIHRVSAVLEVEEQSFDQLVEVATEVGAPQVVDRSFAVRVRRRGKQPWQSPDLAAAIGERLLPHARKVDLKHPESEVKVEAYGDVAYMVERSWDGPGGLPLGTQGRCISMLSGGYDSPVATWMLMRRGSPTDFVHLRLDCAETSHALLVAHELWRCWGQGTEPRVWLVEFEAVKEAIAEHVPGRFRQIVLKRLMYEAADRVATMANSIALVTGESVGQVSTQTLQHLSLLDKSVQHLVLRPLVGNDKEEIIALSRRIGLADVCARALEACSLDSRFTATSASATEMERARADVADKVLEEALASVKVIRLPDWVPGMEDA